MIRVDLKWSVACHSAKGIDGERKPDPRAYDLTQNFQQNYAKNTFMLGVWEILVCERYFPDAHAWICLVS